MSTTYLVDIEMRTKGDLGLGKANDLTGKVGSLKKGFDEVREVAGNVGDLFTGLVEKAAHFAMHAGMIGGAAGIAAVTYGVVGLNQELENTNISLAAIFNAQGFAKDFNEGLALASDTVAKMKQDVKTLPGDLGQLASIFKTIATPGAQAGANVDTLRKMAGQTLMVGGVMGLDNEQSARQMAMLLGGRAGARNILGARMGFIGDAAKELNAMAPEERLAKVQEALAKYQPAMDAYAHSFVGMFTTLKDNIKYSVLTPATQPLFESVKDSLEKINSWFDRNSDKVGFWARRVGDELQKAFYLGVSAVERWYPAIRDFAVNAYGEILNIWQRIQPAVDRVGESVRSFMSDTTAIDKIGHVLELYAAIKVGGTVASGIGGAVQFGGGLAMISKGLGLGGAAAGAVGGAEAGAVAGGAELAGAGVGAVVGETAAALGPLGIAAALAAVEFYGANHAISDSTSFMHDTAVSQMSGLRDEWSKLKDTASSSWLGIKTAFEAVKPALESVADIMGTVMVFEARAAAYTLNTFLAPLRGIADILGFHAGDEDQVAKAKTEPVEHLYGQMQKTFDTASNKRKLEHPGGGTTNIKVEIVATSNADPNRVAKLVFNEFINLRRHSKTSPDIPNWSTMRPQ